MINPFNFALTMTRQIGVAPVMEEKKKQKHLGGARDGREEEAETVGRGRRWKRRRSKDNQAAQVMEEKKKRRHLGGTSDGREEEAEAPGWP